MKSQPHKPTPRVEGRGVARLIGPAIVAVITFVAFIPALSAEYSDFDDFGTLIATQGYRGLELENIRWMFTTTALGHYQPLAWLSFALEWVIAGDMYPAVSHSINVVIHTISAVLVCLLARRLIAIARPSLSAKSVEVAAVVGALLFAVHPLRVESVAWVTERRDVLSLMLFLLTLLAYVRAYPPGSTKAVSSARAVLVFVLFVLSLLAKAWGMTFFLVLMTLDWYPLRRLPWPGAAWLRPEVRTVLLQKLPFAVIGLGWAFVAGTAASSMPGTTLKLAQWGVVDRMCQASYGVMFYLWKTVWPSGLAALYEIPSSISPTEPRVIAGFATVIAIFVVCLLLRKRAPAVVAACAAYVVIVSPVLGLFQSGIQLVADRYSYVSMVGFAIVAGAVAVEGTARLLRGPRRAAGKAAGVGLVLLIGGLMGLTIRQAGFWRDSLTLFQRVVDVGQNGPIVMADYGGELDGAASRAKGEERTRLYGRAIEAFRRAIEQKPDYGEVWYKLGNTLRDTGQFGEAEAAYKNGQKYMPDSWRADSALGLLYVNRMNRLHDAIPLFRAAVEKIEGPQEWTFNPEPYLLLASALGQSGDEETAKRYLLKAVKFRETHDRAAALLKDLAESP